MDSSNDSRYLCTRLGKEAPILMSQHHWPIQGSSESESSLVFLLWCRFSLWISMHLYQKCILCVISNQLCHSPSVYLLFWNTFIDFRGLKHTFVFVTIWLGCAIHFACKWSCTLVFCSGGSLFVKKREKDTSLWLSLFAMSLSGFPLGTIATTWIEVFFVSVFSVFSTSLLKVSSVSKYLEQFMREQVLNYSFSMVTRLRSYQTFHVFLYWF